MPDKPGSAQGAINAMVKKFEPQNIPVYEEAIAVLKRHADAGTAIRKAAQEAGETLPEAQLRSLERREVSLADATKELEAAKKKMGTSAAPPAPPLVPDLNRTNAGKRQGKGKKGVQAPAPEPVGISRNAQLVPRVLLYESEDLGQVLVEGKIPFGSTKEGIEGQALFDSQGPIGRAYLGNPNLPPSPILRRYLNEWGISGATTARIRETADMLRSPVALAAGRLAENAGRMQTLTPVAGGLPGAAAKFGVEGLRGRSNFTDSLIDAWSTHQYGRMVARLASGNKPIPNHIMRKFAWDDGHLPPALSAQRQTAELGRFTARKEVGFGTYGGQIAGQAVFSLIAGRLGSIAAWASKGKIGAAAAVESLLGKGRGALVNRASQSFVGSYTGNSEDDTSDVHERVQQLRATMADPEGLRERIRAAVAPVAAVSPDLALHMEDIAHTRLINLASRAPAFIATPGLVPDRPFGAQYDNFVDYERITQDPEEAVKAVKTGTLTKTKAEASREQHPAQHQEMVTALLDSLTHKKLQSMTPHQLDQAELLVGYDLVPKARAQQQGVYERMKEKAAQMPGGGEPNPRGIPKATMGQQQAAPITRPR
jgi:hypothetical protein